MRILPVILLALIVLVQGELWFGHSGIHYVNGLRAELQTQQEANGIAKAHNDRVTAEITDLRNGLEMVEEKARLELGMIRPDEVLVVIAKPSTSAR
jgi:cell division protein FtsB